MYSFPKELESAGFDGMLLGYAIEGDPFTWVSKISEKESKFEYVVAVRPWTISPQYVTQILDSLNEISSPEKISINFVPGGLNQREKEFGGILGEVNENSDQQYRREYLADFMKEFHRLHTEKNKIFVSGHHPEIAEICNLYSDYIIMDYQVYKQFDDINPSEKDLYLGIDPIIDINPEKKRPYALVVSERELYSIIKHLEERGVKGIFIHRPILPEYFSNIKDFVKKYKNGYFEDNLV